MVAALKTILQVTLCAGAVLGLGMCFAASVHGDWPIALISFAMYAFSLVMLS